MKVKFLCFSLLLLLFNLHGSFFLKIYLMTLKKKEKVNIEMKQGDFYKGEIVNVAKKTITIKKENEEIINIKIKDIKELEVDKDKVEKTFYVRLLQIGVAF